MKAVKAELKEAEKTRKFLVRKNYYDHDYLIEKIKKAIYFPVNKAKIPGMKVEERNLKKLKKQTMDKELKEKIPKNLHSVIPAGFDVIGDIAILEIDDKIKLYEKTIADAILAFHKNIKTIVAKASAHEGTFRTRTYRHLAGKRTKETTHKENDVLLNLDIEKSYFSERLSNERNRIAKQIGSNENILVMFSGVGPYVFVLAKKARHVMGIEINPDAHKYAINNKKLNKAGNADLICGDVKKIIPSLTEKFDRILMPLPKTGELFLEDAFKAIKKGGIIHFYDFVKESDFPDETLKKIESECKKQKIKYKILNAVKCGAYSPGHFRVCIDFTVF